jgi:hypothetical protein
MAGWNKFTAGLFAGLLPLLRPPPISTYHLTIGDISMHTSVKTKPHTGRVTKAVVAVALATCSILALAAEIKVTLSGAEEVPPVATSASGSGTIVINDDKSVSGSITTTGIAATAAHIHMAATGENGGVIVPFVKSGENSWSPQPGAKLSDEQYARFKAGGLYVNVHSAANKGGEIRGQLKP